MPTYTYRCAACSHTFDAFQKFSDAPLTACPACGGAVRRVFQPVGVVFKGTGWYINDSRKTTSGSNGKSDTATESKPETTAPAAASTTASEAKAAAD